jgi:hypothetical protein
MVRYKLFIELEYKTGGDIDMRYRRVEGHPGMYETRHRVGPTLPSGILFDGILGPNLSEYFHLR